MAVLTVGPAISGKSTCRSSGEQIPKGALRVGLEAYVGGRIVQTWQLPRPFLESCFLEICKQSSGTCKATGYKFKKGDVRFVVTSKDKKAFLTLKAAAEELGAVLQQTPDFEANNFKGLDALDSEHRRQFNLAFKVNDDKDKLRRQRQNRAMAREVTRQKSSTPQNLRDANIVKHGEAGDIEGGTPVLVVEEAEARSVASNDKENTNPQRLLKKEEPPAPLSPGAGLSAYEKARAEQMARNKARLMALQLPGLVADFTPKTVLRPPPPRGLPVKRKRTVEDQPRRVSLRQRGVASDGLAVSEELAGGKVVVISGEHIRLGAHVLRQPSPPKDRHPKGTLPLKGENSDEGTDAAWLKLLRAEGPQTSTAKSTEIWSRSSVKQLVKLQLRADAIAKVTREGIVHLAFHPTTQRLLIAAGDKAGHVGLWDVDHSSSGEEPAREGSSDVLELRPHYEYICGLRWAGGQGADARLFTCSYDGSIRILDPSAACFSLGLADEESEFSAMDVTADSRSGFVGDKDGNLEVLDFRAAKCVQAALSLHDRKINTLHVEPGEERLLVSGSADNTVGLWDIRQLGRGAKAIARGAHGLTCQAAFWAPDGSKKVVTTSRDNTLKVWDGGRSLAQLLSIRHDNNTGRWISPFRATWGFEAQSILVGNMKRVVDVYDAEGSLAIGLNSENMTAICSRQVVHPNLAVLASATASGRMYLWR
eukprot:jgi/Botrbrau1/12648/Bobra.67_1s0014.1